MTIGDVNNIFPIVPCLVLFKNKDLKVSSPVESSCMMALPVKITKQRPPVNTCG